MGRFIIKLQRGQDVRYLEWSTIVDAPITFGMTLDDLEEYVKDEYGRQGVLDLPFRLERVEAKGTSAHHEESASAVMAYNRAGPNETRLTEDEIWEKYCVHMDDDWVPERAADDPLRGPFEEPES